MTYLFKYLLFKSSDKLLCEIEYKNGCPYIMDLDAGYHWEQEKASDDNVDHTFGDEYGICICISMFWICFHLQI